MDFLQQKEILLCENEREVNTEHIGSMAGIDLWEVLQNQC